MTMTRHDPAWRSKPMTENQRIKFEELGIVLDRELTIGQASDILTDLRKFQTDCPICGQHDMKRFPHDGHLLIQCTNPQCVSNGGHIMTALWTTIQKKKT
jgi:hypothetical protein